MYAQPQLQLILAESALTKIIKPIVRNNI